MKDANESKTWMRAIKGMDARGENALRTLVLQIELEPGGSHAPEEPILDAQPKSEKAGSRTLKAVESDVSVDDAGWPKCLNAQSSDLGERQLKRNHSEASVDSNGWRKILSPGKFARKENVHHLRRACF